MARLQGLDLHSGRSLRRNLEKPVIVVATQTLEVGADLDFDGLVTECASLDALRQRFGRLNRMGRGVNCRAVIVIRADQAIPKRGEEDDPIYGNALSSTWKWLKKWEGADGAVDFGIAAMDGRVEEQGDLAELNAPAASAPVMLPAHVDCWAQTAPIPRPSPDVAPFLRGPRQGAPDVQVCWRADLDLSSEEGQDRAIETLSLCPPSSGEMLPVPIGVFRRWLSGAEDAEDRSADLPHADESDEEDAEIAFEREAGGDASRRVIRWRGSHTGTTDISATPGDVRPGDVIVIPTSHPGPWDRLGDLTLDAAGISHALDVAIDRIASPAPGRCCDCIRRSYPRGRTRCPPSRTRWPCWRTLGGGTRKNRMRLPAPCGIYWTRCGNPTHQSDGNGCGKRRGSLRTSSPVSEDSGMDTG